jgi:hypothetical protein
MHGAQADRHFGAARKRRCRRSARARPSIDLELLPATGFQVSCFPANIHAASAGWTRAVAILE